MTRVSVADGATESTFYVSCFTASTSTTITATAAPDTTVTVTSAAFSVQGAAPSIRGGVIGGTLLKNAFSTPVFTFSLATASPIELTFNLASAPVTCTYRVGGADVTSLVLAAGETSKDFTVSCPVASGQVRVTATNSINTLTLVTSGAFAVQNAVPTLTSTLLDGTVLLNARSSALFTLTLDTAPVGFDISFDMASSSVTDTADDCQYVAVDNFVGSRYFVRSMTPSVSFYVRCSRANGRVTVSSTSTLESQVTVTTGTAFAVQSVVPTITGSIVSGAATAVKNVRTASALTLTIGTASTGFSLVFKLQSTGSACSFFAWCDSHCLGR